MRPSAARVCRTARPSPTETEGRPKFSGFGPVGRRNGYALSAKRGAGFLAPRINSPHASKALSSNPMFPDRSPTGLGADPKYMKLLQNYYARVAADFFRRQVPVLQALQVSCKTLRATLVAARCWGLEPSRHPAEARNGRLAPPLARCDPGHCLDHRTDRSRVVGGVPGRHRSRIDRHRR
jgi:hypothetical protein